MPNSNDRILTIGPYTILEKLGSGSFATVYRCEHALTHHKYAGKLYHFDFAISDIGYSMVRREVSILKLLRGPRVIHFQEIVYTRNGILVVMELVEGRTLLNVIPSGGGLPESFARPIFRQILEALRFLHCNGIVHRDLKLENIMIQQDGNIKLVDFGLADYVPESARRTGLQVKNRCGSPHYYAPEMILSIPHERFLGDKVDIWAAGVLLYSLVTGFHPFYADDDKEDILFEQITNVDIMYDSDFSREMEHLLRQIFMRDPASRASLQELLNHPWTNNTALAGLADVWIQPRDTESSSSTLRLLEYWSLSEQPRQLTNSDDKDSIPEGSSDERGEDESGDTVTSRRVTDRNIVSNARRTSSTDAVDGEQGNESSIEEEIPNRPQTAKSAKAKKSSTQRALVQKTSEVEKVSSLKLGWHPMKEFFKGMFRKREDSDSSEDRTPTDSEDVTHTSGDGDENRPPSLSTIGNREYSRDTIRYLDSDGRLEDREESTAARPYCKFSFLCWGKI